MSVKDPLLITLEREDRVDACKDALNEMTDAQRHVLLRHGVGQSQDAIAEALSISVSDVSEHLAAARQILEQHGAY